MVVRNSPEMINPVSKENSKKTFAGMRSASFPKAGHRSGLMKPDTHLGENARHIEVLHDLPTDFPQDYASLRGYLLLEGASPVMHRSVCDLLVED